MAGLPPIISIITPTYNRADELVHLYESLKKQTVDLKLFEFIISDDGSTDITQSMVEEWQFNSPFKINFISQKNQGPGAARNHGLDNAKGELILFIDSDCEAHPDWVSIIYNEYLGDTFDAFGGPDSDKEDFTNLQKAINFSMTSYLTTGGMRGHSKIMASKFYPRTHNMGIKKSIYKKIGGFGGLRHGQDIEYSNRIRKSGARVKFLINAIVFHRRRSSLTQFFKQVFNWGVARINLGKIDGTMLEPIHFLPALVTLNFLIILVGSFVNAALFLPFLYIGFSFLFLLSLIGIFQTKSFIVGYYIILTVPYQIFGYGIGFLIQFIRRYLFGLGEWNGFTKRYYK
jgi:glycosyltransferase involved in cell wall biosynthesis